MEQESQESQTDQESRETLEKEQYEKRLADSARMSGNGKSVPGYIRKYRRVNIIWLIVWIAVGVGIFTTGWFIWHTRANILTVLAVLMVLPSAKRIVALVALGRKSSVEADRCHAVETTVEPYIYAGELDIHELSEDEPAGIEENVIFTDYVFTSTEKVMMLDFMVVTKGTIFILPASNTRDTEYVQRYLTKGIRDRSKAFDIHIVWDDKKLIKGLAGLNESPAPASDRREVLAYLKSLAL